MPTQKISKNLPKRASSTHAKDKRAESYKRGQARKVLRQQEQDRRHKANLERVARGEPTPSGRTTWPRKRLHGDAKVAFKRMMDTVAMAKAREQAAGEHVRWETVKAKRAAAEV